MSNLDKYRHLNQDDWKRTQVRMPQDLYADLTNYAKENNLSLNSAMIVLMNKGLEYKQDGQPFSLTSQQLEQLAAQAGKAYMLVIANTIKDLPEEEGNRQLRNLIKEFSS